MTPEAQQVLQAMIRVYRDNLTARNTRSKRKPIVVMSLTGTTSDEARQRLAAAGVVMDVQGVRAALNELRSLGYLKTGAAGSGFRVHNWDTLLRRMEPER